MKTKLFTLFVLLIGVLISATGCNSEPASASTEVPPEAVVQSYYDWYLSYIGDRFSDNFRNPLVDRAYRDSEQLSPAFVEKIDALLDSFNGAGYDPFLCAQDIPTRITVQEATVTGDSASTVVNTDFFNHQFGVYLLKVDGAWKISDIVCR